MKRLIMAMAMIMAFSIPAVAHTSSSNPHNATFATDDHFQSRSTYCSSTKQPKVRVTSYDYYGDNVGRLVVKIRNAAGSTYTRVWANAVLSDGRKYYAEAPSSWHESRYSESRVYYASWTGTTQHYIYCG